MTGNVGDLLGRPIVLNDEVPDGAVLIGTAYVEMHPNQAARMGLPTGKHALRAPWWRRLWRRLTGQQQP